MRFFKIKIFLLTQLIFTSFYSQNYSYKIGLLKYNGGGDWYANPTALSNLIEFCNSEIGTNINPVYDEVEVGDNIIFNYPYIHLTGHGNIVFDANEVSNLKNYLLAGGFLHISDNYGLDPFIRKEMKKIFPELDFIELPFDHPIYHQNFDFNEGLPKIHQHDEKPSLGLGLIYKGRLVCFYDYECDLGDGWEDADVHNDSEEARIKALEMGANILSFTFLGKKN
ncbi:MAG: hypothetical protein CL821_09300 [Crocinitomicaceae bacterium]|nr:hypothetical protein [Crocinitomicaceae bacterium]|tara:strand:- start:2329 stop:3000 length:672 start_codon:yes stop_codon:yes gene_type:complete